jgi:hypothetical protein
MDNRCVALWKNSPVIVNRLGIIATAVGLIAAIFTAGMAWQSVLNTQRAQQDALDAMKHILVSEFPAYTWSLYDK